MIITKTIQSLVEGSPIFRPLKTGWSLGKCPCCVDYKPRAGFKIEDGMIVYNCWNCSLSAGYKEYSGKMTHKFKKILLAMQIDADEISSIVNSGRFLELDDEPEVVTLSSLKSVNTYTPEIPFPPKTFALGHSEFLPLQDKILSYLKTRNIDTIKYKFFFSLDEKLIDRVIIPFYRNGKLIYWQGRSIDNDTKRRYENSPNSRDAILFNYDQLNTISEFPLFVFEGVFDAMLVDGISLIGSKLNEAKIQLLKSSRRRLIFVIDKDNNGKVLAKQVLDNGWEITFTPGDSKDLSESVKNYGYLWTMHELVKLIPKDLDNAKFLINLNCR